MLGAAGAADLVHHVHDRFVGAAVQRALKRADGGGDGTVEVGKRGGDHAAGEGGGVEAVLGVQDQRGLERCDDGRVGELAEAHVKEVRRETKIIAEQQGAHPRLTTGDQPRGRS